LLVAGYWLLVAGSEFCTRISTFKLADTQVGHYILLPSAVGCHRSSVICQLSFTHRTENPLVLKSLNLPMASWL
jgi:hypothetical protein